MSNYTMKDAPVVCVKMRPVCECGYVFDYLSYNMKNNVFLPQCCQNRKKMIETLAVREVQSYKLDADGNLTFCVDGI